MVQNNVTLIIIAIFVTLLAVYYNWLYEYFLVLGYTRNYKPYDGGKCRKIEGVEACEDIHIHHRTGYAFMPCGTAYERTRIFWPPIETFFNTSHQIKDTPYIYDIDNDKIIPLVLKNFPPDEDFSTHGLGIYEDPENENKLYLFFVNHKRSGSVFEIFEHTLHTNELIHLETVKHELINTPNDVIPISKHEFYFTNDHYYKEGPWKTFETYTRRPWSNVVFHSSITNETRIVADGLRLPNGINTNWDRSLIYVSSPVGGEVLIFERDKNNNELKLKDKVFSGYLTDNISVDDLTGELYCAIFPKPLVTLAYNRDQTGTAPAGPIGVLKISNNTDDDGVKYTSKVVFEDDGTLFHTSTVAAVDRKRNVLLIGSFSANGILRCNSLEP